MANQALRRCDTLTRLTYDRGGRNRQPHYTLIFVAEDGTESLLLERVEINIAVASARGVRHLAERMGR